MCLLVVYALLDYLPWMAEATGDQKEAGAESLPQLPCHFLSIYGTYGVVCQ